MRITNILVAGEAEIATRRHKWRFIVARSHSSSLFGRALLHKVFVLQAQALILLWFWRGFKYYFHINPVLDNFHFYCIFVVFPWTHPIDVSSPTLFTFNRCCLVWSNIRSQCREQISNRLTDWTK